MTTKYELIEWLQDAYAMEKAMEMALERLLDDELSSPLVREKAIVHLAETHDHEEAVEACLQRLGAAAFSSKTSLDEGLAVIRGMSPAFASDERVQDVLAVYAS